MLTENDVTRVRLMAEALEGIAHIAADTSLAATIKVLAIQARIRELSAALAALREE